MQWRRTELSDIPAIRKLWERAEYGFPFPDLDSKHLISSWVAVESERIVCWSGAQLVPEIISIMSPEFGSPHERLRCFAAFHKIIAHDVKDHGYERAFCTVDPRYPKFARRLIREKLGWFRWWETLWITTKDALK
jgi:hypothetical protein